MSDDKTTQASCPGRTPQDGDASAVASDIEDEVLEQALWHGIHVLEDHHAMMRRFAIEARAYGWMGAAGQYEEQARKWLDSATVLGDLLQGMRTARPIPRCAATGRAPPDDHPPPVHGVGALPPNSRPHSRRARQTPRPPLMKRTGRTTPVQPGRSRALSAG